VSGGFLIAGKACPFALIFTSLQIVAGLAAHHFFPADEIVKNEKAEQY